ncbi:hypothetical protein ACFMBG_11605 [Leisingera sp. D0M16]|uniref:hypothetical protein n=1 Tax=Leisingera coralii TaxID=3351347 RepID=UPI003B7C6574
MTTFASEPAPPLFIILNSCKRPRWTADQKKEGMNTIASDRIIGTDVSRDWFEIRFLQEGKRARLPKMPQGHARVLLFPQRTLPKDMAAALQKTRV